MKKVLFILSIILCSLASCTIEPSNNGDLDGYWCLCQVDSVNTNKSIDYRQERVFWSFQNKLMLTRQFIGSAQEYAYRFSYEGNTLKIYNPCINDRTQGDLQLSEDSINVIRPHGINNLNEEFTVEELTGSSMILKNGLLRLHFTKY